MEDLLDAVADFCSDRTETVKGRLVFVSVILSWFLLIGGVIAVAGYDPNYSLATNYFLSFFFGFVLTLLLAIVAIFVGILIRWIMHGSDY